MSFSPLQGHSHRRAAPRQQQRPPQPDPGPTGGARHQDPGPVTGQPLPVAHSQGPQACAVEDSH